LFEGSIVFSNNAKWGTICQQTGVGVKTGDKKTFSVGECTAGENLTSRGYWVKVSFCGMGFGVPFLVTFLLLSGLYVGGGHAYGRLALKRAGGFLAVHPHSDTFWPEVVGLVRDGVVFAKQGGARKPKGGGAAGRAAGLLAPGASGGGTAARASSSLSKVKFTGLTQTLGQR
jgi:hypothetical protein